MRQDDPQGFISAAEAGEADSGLDALAASDHPASLGLPSEPDGGFGSRTGVEDTDFDSDELLRTISGLESKLERLRESHVRAAEESEAMREAARRAAAEAEEAARAAQAEVPEGPEPFAVLDESPAASEPEALDVPLAEPEDRAEPEVVPEPGDQEEPADECSAGPGASTEEPGTTDEPGVEPIDTVIGPSEPASAAFGYCVPTEAGARPSVPEEAEVLRRVQELDDREGVIEAQYERIDAEWQDIQRARAEIQGRVARAEEDAARHAEAMRAIEEERARLAELEKEAGAAIRRAETIGVEMARMKRVVTDLEAQSPDRKARQAEARRRARIRLRRALAGGVWVVTACVLFFSLAALVFAPGSGLGLTLLGLAFGAHFFGSMLVAGRLVDTGTIPIGMLGASVGLWVPAWERLTATTMMTLDIPLELFPVATHGAVPMAIAGASAAAVLGVGLLVLCGSFGLFGLSLLAAGLLGAALLIDGAVPGVGIAGAVVWVVLMGAGLSRWAASAGREPNPFQPE